VSAVLDSPPSGLSPALVAEARASAKSSGRALVDELELRLALGPTEFVALLGASCGVAQTTLADTAGYHPDFNAVPFAEAMQRQCVVAHDMAGAALFVFIDPFDDALAAWRRFRFRDALPLLLHRTELNTWLARCEESLTALGDVPGPRTNESVASVDAEVISLARIGADSSPVVQFVNSTLYDALKVGASDIHIESDPKGLTVKFRLDGVLSVMGHRDGVTFAEQTLSRVKVMAELDIAERRIPQDGRLQVVRNNRAIDVRVSVMPSVHGEDAVLRILDREALASELSGLSLASLGFAAETAAAVRRIAKLPYGMLLVTGPTGSGKTTTLYAALSDTHNPEEKTITIEDPVEYHLPGVLQIPVNEKKGLTFARGLRSILRHDPDRILVGEIRDAETAQIAVQSALTGHLVFTTVHANSVLDVFGRFLQFGIDPYSFVSALNGVLAQRLLRRLCSHCATRVSPAATLFDETGVDSSLRDTGTWMRAVGCAHCRGTGYKGRFAIGETLRLDAKLRSLIAQRAALIDIDAAARLAGLITLHEQAIRSAAAGQTTLEEVNRVTTA
jgi:general secretion pathway protein E